jgi:hypothetical protein
MVSLQSWFYGGWTENKEYLYYIMKRGGWVGKYIILECAGVRTPDHLIKRYVGLVLVLVDFIGFVGFHYD